MILLLSNGPRRHSILSLKISAASCGNLFLEPLDVLVHVNHETLVLGLPHLLDARAKGSVLDFASIQDQLSRSLVQSQRAVAQMLNRWVMILS
jgi:hypothetical protein